MSDILTMIHAYFAVPGNENGGNLHIALEDGNMEDSHIEFCREVARECHDYDGVKLAEALLAMSFEEREKLYEAGGY